MGWVAVQMTNLTHKVVPALVPGAEEEATEAPATVHGAPESAQVGKVLHTMNHASYLDIS